jgi:hypothetical protein
VTGKIFEPEFKRESAEIMRKLKLGHGYVLRDGRSGEWGLWSCKNGWRAPVGGVADRLVHEMQARDLLKPRPGGGLMPSQGMPKVTSRIEIADPEGRIAMVERNEAECALDWLRGRKDHAGESLIGDELFAAAERLRTDYTQAQMEQRVTASWDRPIESGARGRLGSNPHLPLNDRALAAKERLFAALSHVGPELSGILLEICCMASGLENAERLLGLPRRSGKAVLQLALTRLARHYGLLPEQLPKLPGKKLCHWAMPGYRPPIG